MFKLRYPIQKFFMWKGRTCRINQLFGENKNNLFYGPKGHRGIDFKTTGFWKYKRSKGSWEEIGRTTFESKGRIPIIATHDGTLKTILYDDKQGMGWGLTLTTSTLKEAGKLVQYKSLYWHIETPWASIKRFTGVVKSIFKLNNLFMGKKIKKGAIIAIGGNNGKSTGPHLHFSLDKRILNGNVWSNWIRIDPMPYFRSPKVIGQRYLGGPTSRWFYEGQEVTTTKAKQILKTI